ncbi:MAG: hypothetical protein ACP5PX_08220, partial [Candidatus Hadarchaeum sp.]|uniref:hypothetical protein n=1 Tax=Candidatus Hadarchaeum sp. TaxID=2883567 RepID=UPI003D1277EB
LELWVDTSRDGWSGFAVLRDPSSSPKPVVLRWDTNRPGVFTVGSWVLHLGVAGTPGSNGGFEGRVELTVNRGRDSGTVTASLGADGGVSPVGASGDRDPLVGAFFQSEEARVLASGVGQMRASSHATGSEGMKVSALFSFRHCLGDYILITSLIGAAIETCSSGMTWGCWAALVAIGQAENQIIDECNCCF